MGGALQAAEGDFGRQTLDTILDELTSYGVHARWVDFYEVTLSADDYTYSLPATVLDVIGDGQYIAASEADTSKASGETKVKQISREHWHHIGAKSATGRPTLMFVNKAQDGDQPELRLWPIPDEAGTIRLQVQSLPADTLEGGATVDLREYWMQYCIWELAHQFAVASSLPEQRCSYLQKRAKEKLERARGNASQKVPNVLVLNHPTPWSR